MTKVDLMIFDLDGTLIRSGRDLAASVNYTLHALGIETLDEKRIIGYIGDGVKKLIERALGNAFPTQFDAAMELFTEYYGDHLLDTTDLYPGVIDMLQHFQDKKKLIVTNKTHNFVRQIASELKLDDYFEDIVGIDSAPYQKPDQRLVRFYMHKYVVQRERIVVIGDGRNDILLARNAGAISCGYLNGLGDRDMLLELEPDCTCEDLSELKTMFY